MKDKKFIVIDVFGLFHDQLEEQMNSLAKNGYKRAFQSSIQWYQGKGEWGVIVFELEEK